MAMQQTSRKEERGLEGQEVAVKTPCCKTLGRWGVGYKLRDQLYTRVLAHDPTQLQAAATVSTPLALQRAEHTCT